MKNNIILRRFGCFCLALILSLTMFSVTPAIAAGVTEITFGEVTAHAGDEIIITVSIENNPGIATFRFRVSCDMEAIECVSVDKGDLLSSGMFSSIIDSDSEAITFLWFSPTDVTGDGDIAQLKFRIKDDANGEYPLNITYLPQDILNDKGEQLDAVVNSGAITVKLIATEDGFVYEKTDNGIIINSFVGNGTDPVIPDEIDGLSVIGIDSSAFKDCMDVNSITVPKTVVDIGEGALDNFDLIYFEGTYEEWNELDTGSDAICNAGTSMEGLQYRIDEKPGTITITGYNGNKTAIDIPKSYKGYTVTAIDPSAFSGSTDITSISIPGTVETIQEGSFEGCISLEKVTLKKGILYIGDNAFYGCTALTSVKIPKSVTTIGGYAFGGCTSLETVELAQTVELIEYRAFYQCNSIATVIYTGTEDEFSNMSIMSGNSAILNADISYLNGESLVCVGDINGDGNVNAVDSNLLKRAIAGTLAGDDEETMLMAADINDDGTVNAVDSNLLKRIIAGTYKVTD